MTSGINHFFSLCCFILPLTFFDCPTYRTTSVGPNRAYTPGCLGTLCAGNNYLWNRQSAYSMAWQLFFWAMEKSGARDAIAEGIEHKDGGESGKADRRGGLLAIGWTAFALYIYYISSVNDTGVITTFPLLCFFIPLLLLTCIYLMWLFSDWLQYLSDATLSPEHRVIFCFPKQTGWRPDIEYPMSGHSAQ